ncbi:serine hydrolase domain-containing protein [Microbacterium koreense]|uniref:Serine hydrolase domain-containing protein n=1 Tax=Microbacterium koreense TaxID=323761 RepID=A0ABW2ZQZ1_9MICO
MKSLDVDPATAVVRDPAALEHAMTRALARVDRARAPRYPAAQVLVSAPGFSLRSGDHARSFHSASVGKTMTGIRAYQLAERGVLDLSAPVTTLLPAAEWRGLFRAPDAVTAAHLLAHTSGVADYFEDRADGSVPFRDLVVRDRDTRWTPTDLLDFTRTHQKPMADAGQRFHYSDTGYVLLARIIEEAGGAALGAQLHEHVFAPAGMESSCLLFHTLPGGSASTSQTPAADLDIAPLWIGDHDISRAASLSCDWGGGGVVTTLDDLDRFLVAWTDGRLVRPDTLARMTDGRSRFRPGIRYGSGAMRVQYGGFSPFLARMPHAIGHLGVSGAHAFTLPEAGIRLVMNFHSTREMLRSFRTHIGLVRRAWKALR